MWAFVPLGTSRASDLYIPLHIVSLDTIRALMTKLIMQKEAMRYIENAKETLLKSPIEDNRYTDDKYVKSACGIAYLGILKAIEEYLLGKGLTKKELPKKVEEYEKALQKYASPYNGKLLREFSDLYDELHIAGYYRGNLHHVGVVKEVFKDAKSFIVKLK